MRLILQRVTSAAVSWESEGRAERRAIAQGLAILAGAGEGDTTADAQRLADKVAKLRIFRDESGRSNLSLLDVGGSALVVSQFTLYGDLKGGRRPSFIAAGEPGAAEPIVDAFAAALSALGVPTETGRFGAHMTLEIVNDGPVTFAVSSDSWDTRV
ncbi:MAG TPA: D-aminoacyl-tRNA deacylase [Candidatus Dormibacteraeota bacterium]